MATTPSINPEQNWDEGFPTVNKPNLPFVGPIPGGISVGKTIQVKGQIDKNATKFSINLQCGENSLPYADAAFHFSPQFNDVVKTNSRLDGVWGTEETNQTSVLNPFARGESFELVIQCENDRYKVQVNGKHFMDYKLRSRLNDVDFVSFDADVEIKSLRFGQGSLEDFLNTAGNGTTENHSVENNHTTLPSTPFTQAVKDTLKAGSLIYIRGYVPTHAQGFSINLQQGDKPIPSVNVSLQLNPRFASHVVRNTMVDEMWGVMEKDASTFPFSRSREFDVKVQCRSTGYKVWVGGKPFTEYSHRIKDFNRINCISVEGNIEVSSISYTQDEPMKTQPTEDQKASESLTPECESVSKADDKQSIDSTNASSVKDEEDAMEVEGGPSEEPKLSPKDSGDDASAGDSNASPPEATPSDSREPSPIEGAVLEKTKEPTGADDDNSKQNKTTEAAETKTEKAPSTKEEDKTGGEPQSKKRKLDEDGKEEDGKEEAAEEEAAEEEEDEEGAVEEEKDEEEKKPKTKKVDKTTWDWELCNQSKPIWTRKPAEIEDGEYDEFYISITKDKNGPVAKTHFIAEGEVTFKSLLFVPNQQQSEDFNKYGQKKDNIKLYVRRVFITDDFQDMMPSYLSFVRGVVDSDDLPLNVSRETLQQHKLLKVIKKKLVRKTLDMIKKIEDEKYPAFWKEYSTNIKLGVIEDTANRTRLAKLLRFISSTGQLSSLADYVERMKDKQEHIYYMAGGSKEEVEKSPFVERLLKKGYEVLYLTEAVDEYAISAIPEFEGKKFQNVAKEGFSIDGDTEAAKARKAEVNEKYDPLIKWMGEDALKDHILRAEISERLTESPCALITSKFGWTANMQRIIQSQTHSKSNDMQRDYYLNQKKTLEINPRHPLIKELLRRVEDNPADQTAKDMALMMYNTATLRSGYLLKDTVNFAEHIEKMMRQTLGVDADEAVDEEEEIAEEDAAEEVDDDDDEEFDEEEEGDEEPHDEL